MCTRKCTVNNGRLSHVTSHSLSISTLLSTVSGDYGKM